MKCVIISEEKVIDLGKRCLSNLKDFVNNEYCLEFNEVKRLRTLFFLACQKVVGEKIKIKLKENPSVIELLKENINEVFEENINEVLKKKLDKNEVLQKKRNIKNINEVWNEKLEEKFWESSMIVEKSKVEDESKIEEVFKTSVCEKYSRVKFLLEEKYRIFDLVKEGLDKCQEINEDLYYEIKNFNYIYHVYNYCYKSLNRF